MYAADQEGSVSDPCDDIYRGTGPFSEYETQAVKYLVEKSGKISSAMNFHAYGNLWIIPFCYYTGTDNFGLMPSEVAEFYKGFEKEIIEMGFTRTGDAEETIKYPANGEASDWMLATHGIISMSPELGTDSVDSEGLYPNKDVIPDVIRQDYRVVELFMKRTLPDFHKSIFEYFNESNFDTNEADLAMKTKPNKHFVFRMHLKSSATLPIRDINASIKYFDNKLPKMLTSISVYENGSLKDVSYNVNHKTKKIKLADPLEIEKLGSLYVYLELTDKIDFDFKISLKRYKMILYNYQNYDEDATLDLFNSFKRLPVEILLTVFWIICILFFLYCLVYYWYRIRKNTETIKVIEIVRDVNKRKKKGEYHDDNDDHV